MPELSEQSRELQACIDRLQAGDDAAREAIIQAACDRLTRLTRKMLHGQPRLERWEETDDVFQNAVVRLWKALANTRPATVQEFFGLAAVVIRRELISLARSYFGPEGPGAHHSSQQPAADSENTPPAASGLIDTTNDPQRLASWGDFHTKIDSLPDEEREVIDLLWYHGLSQNEAAELLHVSERTVQRRWQSARLKIYEAFHGRPPGM